jgi:hypothetical protein
MLSLILALTAYAGVTEAGCGAKKLNYIHNGGKSYCRAFTKLERRDIALEKYLRSITRDYAEYQRVDDILADTVLEGDECYVYKRGDITKECKQRLKEQVRIEREIE